MGRTIIVNNIVYWNGGSGITAYSSGYVSIDNNTTFKNSQSAIPHTGEVAAYASSNVNMINNICYAAPGRLFYGVHANAFSVIWGSNLLFSTTIAPSEAGSALGRRDMVADPIFTDPANADFELAAESPAIGTGTNSFAPRADFLGNPRPRGKIDRGAYQD
jgi:hypothetical protein